MCYTCHKVIRNPGQIVPCERCVLPFCSAKCMAVHRMDARECDLRAKIREGGGIVGLGNAGKQTAGAGRDFSKLAASFLQDRMEMILLQASLIGENVTDCVIVVNLDDEESSAMTIPIDSYDISEMGSNGDADNDAHTRFVLERNRKAGGLTAMCHDGHSCLMKTMAHPPGKPDYWLVKQKEVAAHYKPTVEYYRAECGGRLGMPRTEQAVQILNSLKDHGELPRPDEMAGLEEEIKHLERVIAGGGGTSGGPRRGATGDERRAVAAAVAAEMAASDGPGRNAKKNAKKRAKKKAEKGGPPPLEDISAGLESASLADCGPRVGDGAEAAAAEATYAY